MAAVASNVTPLRQIILEIDESSGSQEWRLILELPTLLCNSSCPVDVDVSSTAVRVSTCVDAAGARPSIVGLFELPPESNCIDQTAAVCKLRRRHGQLVVTWPATTVEAIRKVNAAAAAADVLPAKVTPAKANADSTAEADAECAETTDASDAATSNEAGQTPQPRANLHDVSAKPLDYSKFDGLVENDVGLQHDEVVARWRRHRNLRLMRGEDPLDMEEWCRRRARLPTGQELDPPGRGLWCKTNLEEAFEEDATNVKEDQDSSLLPLAAPELAGALLKQSGSKSIDATKWARTALRTELVKACATDRHSVQSPDLHIDAIVHGVEIGTGNAVVVARPDQSFLCVFSFRVDISFCVKVAERPAPGEQTPELRFTGNIAIAELTSGSPSHLLPQLMRTSLQSPKPSAGHLSTMRPILLRLEISLAHFVERFRRRFTEWPSEAERS